jgi:hypothetical protein
LEAPTYPPAAAFEQPIAQPYLLRLDNVSLAELMSVPEARDIVLKHLPSLKMALDSPMLKPHLGDMTVESLWAFTGPPSPEVLAAIKEELSRLPPVQGSAP